MASLHLLLLLITCSWLCQSTLLPNLVGDILLTRLESPYDATGDTIIPYGSTVTIESGTTLRFPRGSQLIVRGTLLAKGTPDRRITFTSSTSALYHEQQQIHRASGSHIRFRLADGPDTQNGLLQMLFKNRWRYVCNEFYRWFDYDATLTCRMMGFRNGTVTPYRINGSDTPWYGLVLDHPACRNNIDEHLLDCPGVRSPPQLGIHICNDKEFVRLQCDGFFDPQSVLNWAGIVFERKITTDKLSDIPPLSDAASPLIPDLNQRQSVLHYVDILHAGLRAESALKTYAERYAAVTIFDNLVNPSFYNISVLYSAADGMNFSNIATPVQLRNSFIAYNRGHGVVLTSRYGNVTFDRVEIHQNGGDGIHYRFNNTEWSLREQEETNSRLYKSFCETANTVEFPSYFTYRPSAAGTCCTQTFSSTYNTRITVHFQSVLATDYRTRYRVEFYDGKFDQMPLLANVSFNRTLESFSSYSNDLLVRLCHSCDDPRNRACWNQTDQIQLYVVTDNGRDADLHVWNSRISNNSLNGIRVVNLRSLIEINQTTINSNHRHGLKIDSGAGSLWTYHSVLNFNSEDGINLHYDGGERRFSYSDISFNGQHGIHLRLDSISPGLFLSSIFYPTFAFHQITFVNGSSIRSNGYYGLWQGPTCHPSLFIVNGSLFERSTFDALRFDSCQHEWRPQRVIDFQFRSPMMPINSYLPPSIPPSIVYQAPINFYPHYPSWVPVALLYANETGNTLFNISWTRFLNNKRVAVRLNPVQNILGDISNNSFIGNENGALFIGGNHTNSRGDVYLRNVTLRILFNNFTNNRGKRFIVSLDLNELSPYQTILFMYNRLMNNNVSSEIQAWINGRSKTAGVLTIGSSHIRILRNIFGNNHSQYEIVSQLRNASAAIQAEMNFFTSIYPPPTTFNPNPMSSYERDQYLQSAARQYQHFPRFDKKRKRRQIQPVSQISYSYMTEPTDLRYDFFPQDSVFQRPYATPKPVQFYPPRDEQEILSIPSINRSALLSSTNNDWPYYAAVATNTPFYYSLYYDRPEVCFSQWPRIRSRIFDQHNRSTLANIVWYPFLCSDRNLTTEIWRCQLPNCGFETTSFRIDPETSTIGGVIDMDFSLSPGRYTVVNDILVKPSKRLTIQSSQLEFLNGVGMFVYGELIVQGANGSPTRFDLYRNETALRLFNNQKRSIMLIDGRTKFEGRLFVTTLNDGSGTVCNRGWKRENSMLVCLSLGMIHDPNENYFPMENINQTRINEPIVWSEVDCDLEQDETLEQCRKETVHTCDHNDDVWIKCLPSSWSGVHIYPSQARSSFEFVDFHSAGQFDVDRDEIHGALHVDLLSHRSNRYKNLTFAENIIGFEINHLHPTQIDEALLDHSTFIRNHFAGLLLRSNVFNVSHTTFREHPYAAIKYDPKFSADLLEQYRIHIHPRLSNVDRADLLHDQFYELERNKFLFVTSTFGGYHTEENILLNTLNIRTDPSFILVVDLLDYDPFSDIDEQLTICEVECFQRPVSTSKNVPFKKWFLSHDRDLFPLITSYSTVQLHYRPFRYRSGRLTLIVYSVPAPIFQQNSNLFDVSIRIDRNLFSFNQHDLIYSFNDRQKASIHRRYRNATLLIENSLFEWNQNRSLLFDHPSNFISPKQIEKILGLINDEQNRTFLPIQFTCRIDKSVFINNRQVINLDAHPLIYSDRLIRLEITESNFTKNENLLLNLTFPRLYPFNRTRFASLSHWPFLPSRSVYTRSPLIYSIPSHVVRLSKNIFFDNNQASIRLSGYHTSFNLTHSIFENNRNSHSSLIDLRQIEKDFLIDGNRFRRNEIRQLISVNFRGHAPFHHDFYHSSSIVYNEFIENQSPVINRAPVLPSACLTIVGSLNVSIQRNVFENQHYDYELVAALITDSINTTLDATFNWWSSDVGQVIQNRILDSTKRSDHAFVQWNPFLTCRQLTCPQMRLPIETILQLNRPLRGLITGHTVIHRRREPYLINGDLLVMPGGELTIEPGVELHFAPNTGILVLGNLNATGTPKDPIVMKLAMKQFVMEHISNIHNSYQYHLTDDVPFSKYKFDPFVDRLQIRLDIGRSPSEGFLQIYNWTRRDWSYVCADSFQQLFAYRLICHQLGLSWKNVLVHSDSFYLFDHQKLPIWHEKIDCAGTEPSLSSCSFSVEPKRTCSKLFYISCYDDNLVYSLHASAQVDFASNLGGQMNPTSSPTYDTPQSWNGIRFANPEYEEDLSSLEYTRHDQSLLRYVLISETSDLRPAIQTVYRTPAIERIHIEHSRQIGFEFLLPKQSLLFGYSRITNALDLAINGLIYDGQSTDEKSTFDLLYEQNINGQPFSLLDLCNAHRMVSIKYRLITFYKYQYDYRTCSKLFCSTNPYKIGIRFFQGNLLNSTYQNDWIELHRVLTTPEGHHIHESIAILTNGSSDSQWKTLYTIEQGCLRLTVHASSGSQYNGFMAEITLFPITPVSTREIVHQISDNIFLGNQQGAIKYVSAGERTANLYFQSNTLLHNGYYRYNSSSPSINYFVFQNTPRFYFGNNWLSRNLGGTTIECFSQSLSSIFNGYVFNNVFYRNKNDSVLSMYGMDMAAFCNLFAMHNAFLSNDAYDRNTISFHSVVANFSRNQVYNNSGVNILSMLGFEKITAPFPAVEMNYFRENNALGERHEQLFDRSGAVVEVGNPRQIYLFNTFVNWPSRYEMKTRRRLYQPNRMESRFINASFNYWGHTGDTNDIGARILDQYDNKTLMQVNFYPPYTDSNRLRQGNCDPGWTLDDHLCFLYFGAATTYRLAEDMCRSVDARITERETPLSRLVVLRSLVRSTQYQGINSDAVPSTGIWLRKEIKDECRIFNDMETMDVSCSATATFICEKEQQFDGFKYIIRTDLFIALIGLILMLVLIILFICCWFCKSRHRRKDNFQRQTSLRRSVKQEINKQSNLSLNKTNDTTLVKSSTMSTLATGTPNKLPLSTLSLSSRPLSSVTLNSDQELSTPSPAHHDFSLLKLNHHIVKSSTPAPSDDMGSQRGLVVDQSSVYSTVTTTDSASLYRSRRRYDRPATATGPPVINRRSLRQPRNPQESIASISTGSVSPPPAYVSPTHQPRRHRPDQLQLLTPNLSSARSDSGPPPPLETDI